MNERETTVIGARLRTTSNRAAAKLSGVPRRTVDNIVRRVIERAEEAGELVEQGVPRILFLDIETAPALSYLWSMWPNGGVNPEMQQERTYLLAYCAKWLGEEEILEDSLRDHSLPHLYSTPHELLAGLWNLLDRADFVVAHNGDRFDIKRINSEFLLADMKPPSPYKQIDTLKMVKRTFGFDSNRLDYLCRVLFGEGKETHDGFKTWVGCMQGVKEAWDDMMKYNRKDVLLLERLYLKLRAWDKSHPNVLMAMDVPPSVPACTTCGSLDVHWKPEDTAPTPANSFTVWECGNCGSQMRDRKSRLTKGQREAMLIKAK